MIELSDCGKEGDDVDRLHVHEEVDHLRIHRTHIGFVSFFLWISPSELEEEVIWVRRYEGLKFACGKSNL